jgi:hypothetical protein
VGGSTEKEPEQRLLRLFPFSFIGGFGAVAQTAWNQLKTQGKRHIR